MEGFPSPEKEISKENPKIQTCPHCGGKGKDKDGKPCNPCFGTGKVKTTY